MPHLLDIPQQYFNVFMNLAPLNVALECELCVTKIRENMI
jgi:hypothetical protein